MRRPFKKEGGEKFPPGPVGKREKKGGVPTKNRGVPPHRFKPKPPPFSLKKGAPKKKCPWKKKHPKAPLGKKTQGEYKQKRGKTPQCPSNPP